MHAWQNIGCINPVAGEESVQDSLSVLVAPRSRPAERRSNLVLRGDHIVTHGVLRKVADAVSIESASQLHIFSMCLVPATTYLTIPAIFS